MHAGFGADGLVLDKSLSLFLCVRQFLETIGEFNASDIEFESLRRARIGGTKLSEGGEGAWVMSQEDRIRFIEECGFYATDEGSMIEVVPGVIGSIVNLSFVER